MKSVAFLKLAAAALGYSDVRSVSLRFLDGYWDLKMVCIKNKKEGKERKRGREGARDEVSEEKEGISCHS